MKPITSLLIALIVLTVGPLAYFKWGGKEYLANMGNSKPSLKLNRDVVYAPATTDKKVKVYKWKDENGVWQFGGTPPNGVTDIQVMNLQPNVNIMKPVEVPGEEPEPGHGSAIMMGSHGNDKDGAKNPLDDPYNPENVADLLKNTKNIQNMLDSRQKAQENALKQIDNR